MDSTTDFYNHEWINIDGNWIHKTAIVHNNVKLGKGNTIGAYAVIGGNGEMRGVKQGAFKGWVEIGDNNVISELVTIQRPYAETCTKIGNNNIVMAHSHVGHDVQIGDDCEICTGTILGGYAIIENNVKIKLGVTVRNRKKIKTGALVGLGSAVVKDVESFVTVVGNPAKPLPKVKTIYVPTIATKEIIEKLDDKREYTLMLLDEQKAPVNKSWLERRPGIYEILLPLSAVIEIKKEK